MATAVRNNVLVVDDDATVRGYVVAVLEEDGYCCGEADGPQAALTAVGELDPDLVVTDVSMPGGSGLDLLRALRDRRPEIAVVMVTGHHDTAIAHEAIDQG